MGITRIWETEQGFWLDGPGFYARHMMAEARMVFPDPVGILKGREILDALDGAPRWDSVQMDERTVLSVGDTLALAYRATGRRGDGAPYVALCSSTYVRQGDGWTLLAHQQTPVG